MYSIILFFIILYYFLLYILYILYILYYIYCCFNLVQSSWDVKTNHVIFWEPNVSPVTVLSAGTAARVVARVVARVEGSSPARLVAPLVRGTYHAT